MVAKSGICEGVYYLDNKKEKKSSVIAERIFDAICLIASYGILFLLPEKTGFFFYLIFSISAFLFCIGFFRLGFTFEAPDDMKRANYAGLVYAVFGALINVAGIYGICRDSGSGRSIMIAVLLMIEALVLFGMAASGAREPKEQWRSGILLHSAAAIGLLFGIVFAVRMHFSEASVIVGILLLIEAICLWEMGGGRNPFNTFTPEIQAVPGMKMPVEQLKAAFACVDTQLGMPWIGKVKSIKQDAIIYGPSEDGFVVYGYYLFGRFYVSGSMNPLFPHPEDAQGHVVKEAPDGEGILLAKEYLPVAYAKMFSRYVESGAAQWSTDIAD